MPVPSVLKHRPLPIQAAGDERTAKLSDYVGLVDCDFIVKFTEINRKHSYSAICQKHLCIIVINVSSFSN